MRSAPVFLAIALSLIGGCSNAPDAAPKYDAPAASVVTHLGAWYWLGTTSASTAVAASDPTRYQIDFSDATTMLVQADCNRGQGGYTLAAGAFATGPIALTKMGCPEDSQDGEFVTQLQNARALATEGDRLHIELADNRGTMHFARDPKSVFKP